MPVVSASALTRISEAALCAAGVPQAKAALQVAVWMDAELRGIASHGLLRLERVIERIVAGLADPAAEGDHEWLGEGFLVVDGRRGLGPVVADKAVRAASERAQRTGVALAAVGNSQHIGMLAWYAEAIARRGQASIVLSTSEALVHPWGGRVAMVGTNPIAIGMPTGEADPFVMDTATSVVSMGEIYDRAQRGDPIPEGWALDAEGRPTTDANAAMGGAIAPFGQAKGYALGLALELLVSGLTGSALGRDVHGTLDSEQLCNKGDLFIVIDRCRTGGLSTYLEAVRETPPAEGFEQVLIPGERGRAVRAERLRNGVPIADVVWQRLLALSGDVGAAMQKEYGNE